MATGDGRSDLVLAFSNSSTWVAMHLWGYQLCDGILAFSSQPRTLLLSTSYPGWNDCAYDLLGVAADFNGDGLSRHFLAGQRTTAAFKNWALWRGPRRTAPSATHGSQDIFFSAPNDYATPISLISMPMAMQTSSGILVKTKTGKSKGQRRLWLGKGDGTFIEDNKPRRQGRDIVRIPCPRSGDFNGDGLPDILWFQEFEPGAVSSGWNRVRHQSRQDRQGRSLRTIARAVAGQGRRNFTVIASSGGLDRPPVGYTRARRLQQ